MAELINPDNYQDFTLEMLRTPDGIAKLNAILRLLAQNISGDTESVRVYQGVGTPEASVAAGVGSLYMRTDGGSNTSVYRKESGSGDTGWVAISAPASLPLSTANGGTGQNFSAGAQGTIPYISATGVFSLLAVGTSGQLLSTQGAAANPAWVTRTPTAYSLLSTTTWTAAATTGNITIDNTTPYLAIIKCVQVSGNDSLTVRFNTDAGANYDYVRIGFENAAAVGGTRTTGQSGIKLTTDLGSTTDCEINMIIMPHNTATNNMSTTAHCVFQNNGLAAITSYGVWTGSGAATSFAIIVGGTYTGTLYLYKMATS